MKKKITSRNGMVVLKLDLSKAYDRVEWIFLRSVFIHMDFPIHLVDLIMNYGMFVSFFIIMSGSPQPCFVPHIGL